ncbi:MAG: ubiquinol-cytochrome c reductase iron-sulfur subunit [Acidimicrobiales bacterium]
MEVLIVVIPAIVVLAAIVIFAASRRSDSRDAQGQLSRETRKTDKVTTAGVASPQAEPTQPEVTGREVERAAALARNEPGGELVAAGAAPPVPWTPPDEEAIGVARRQFLNRSIIGLMGFSLSSFGVASIAFLYGGGGSEGFGSKINLGKISDVEANIANGGGFFYVPEGRMWVTKYPAGSLVKAEEAYSAPELIGMRAGLIALFQKCPHLGCRVPECGTSQWFECPCHGSQYNRVGEKKGGPAPRGMDRFAMDVTDGVFTVDTGTIILGPPIGTNTTGQEAEGPHCVGEGEA